MTEVDIEIAVGHTVPIAVSSTNLPTPASLAVQANGAGGTFAANTYFWVITATDALGETTASNEVTTAIVLNGSATLTWTYLPPGTTGVKVYRGTATGAENALIATLGPVLTYTDTGTAGTAFSPPTVNTAEIGTQIIVSGACNLAGYAIRETSGTAPVSLSLRTGGAEIFPIQVAASGVDKQWLGGPGLHIRNQLILKVNSGTFAGALFVRYY